VKENKNKKQLNCNVFVVFGNWRLGECEELSKNDFVTKHSVHSMSARINAKPKRGYANTWRTMGEGVMELDGNG